MRLEAHEVMAIKAAARLTFGQDAVVRLYGSRAIDARRADRIDTLSYEDESKVLTFLKRFEQFEDALNRTLKAISKIMEHGKIERLTSVDVMRRAYALGIVSSEKMWANAVRTRNALAHEYPLNPGKRTAQVNTAWAARETLFVTWTSIGRFIEDEGLLS